MGAVCRCSDMKDKVGAYAKMSRNWGSTSLGCGKRDVYIGPWLVIHGQKRGEG